MPNKRCNCSKWPACQAHAHPLIRGSSNYTCEHHGHMTFGAPPNFGHDGPPCIWCNAPTRRAGSCWVCSMCGASTSC